MASNVALATYRKQKLQKVMGHHSKKCINDYMDLPKFPKVAVAPLAEV